MFVLINLKRVQKRVMSGQKLGQILEKYCVCSRGHIFSPIIMVRVFVLMKSQTSLEMGHVGSKTMSLGQM